MNARLVALSGSSTEWSHEVGISSTTAVLLLSVLALASCGGASGESSDQGSASDEPSAVAIVELESTGASVEDGTIRVTVQSALDRGSTHDIGEGTLRMSADKEGTHRFVETQITIENLTDDDRGFSEGTLAATADDEVLDLALVCFEGRCTSGGKWAYRVFPSWDKPPLELSVFWVVPVDADAFDLEIAGSTSWDWDVPDRPRPVAPITEQPVAPVQEEAPVTTQGEGG